MAATDADGTDRPGWGRSFRVRPALWAALPFLPGIALYEILPQLPIVWILLATGAIVSAWIFDRRGRSLGSCICIVIAIASAGVATTQLAAFAFPSDQIARYTTDAPRLCSVKLRITEPLVTIESSQSWMMPSRQLCVGEVLAVQTRVGWRPASGGVQLSLAEAAKNLSVGQTVLAVGMLSRPTEPMNPGQFDEAKKLRQQGILAQLEIRHASAVQVLSQARPPLLPTIQSGAGELLQAGFAGDNAQDGALLEALVLGTRPSSLHEVEDDFSAAGVMHLLASNGARIALFAGSIFMLSRLFGLHPRTTVYFAAVGAVVYGCLTSQSPQALRPVLLCVAVGAAMVGRRMVDSVQLLAFAAIALLIAQPMDLFAVGFQLSFISVLGLMLLSGSARRAWIALEDPDEQVLSSFDRLSPIRLGWRSVRRKMFSLLAMALIAWAAAMPLVVYHFQQLNPYSVPVGLLLSPLVFVCLLAGMAKIALTAAVPGLASAWSGVAGAPVALLRHAVHLAAKLPGSNLPTATPGVGWLIVWYGGLLSCLLPWRAWLDGKQRRWSMALRLGSPVMGLILLAMPLAGMNPVHAEGRPLRITVLAVGAGQCVVIEAPDGKATLIDAGSTSTSQMMREVLEPFLRLSGRQNVARLFLSSSATDRASAAGDVVAECGEPEVFTSAGVGRSPGPNLQYARLLDHLDRVGRSAKSLRAGQSIDLGQGVSLMALWPPVGGTNAGLVLKLQYAGRSILFPGDLDETAEQALVSHRKALSADLLIAPHQGICDAQTAGLIRAVDPAVVISSDSNELTTRQQRLAAAVADRPLLRTGQCGSVTIEIAAAGDISIVPFLSLQGDRGGERLGIAPGERRVHTERSGAAH